MVIEKGLTIVENAKHISDELKLISPLLDSISRESLYEAPVGYFDTLPGKILSRLGAISDPVSPVLAQAGRDLPFKVPEGYFNELAANVISGVQAIEFVNDELETPPFLASGLKDKATYQAPVGYFDGLADAVLAKLQLADGRQSAKVIPISRKRSWWKYSAAAAVAGLVLTTVLTVFNKPSKTGSGDPLRNLSKVSDQEIENYLDNHNVPLSEAATNSIAVLDINDSDIRNMLGDVSDDELKQYVDEHGGTAKDLATN